MEVSIIIKLLITLISALGTITAYKLNAAKSKQTQADLIIQFENALESKNKYSTCELFALIYGINMDYKDILELIKRDDLNTVLFHIKKSPGVIAFKNGELKYSAFYEKPWVRKMDKYISNGLFFSIVVLTVTLFLMLIFATGKIALFTLALLVIVLTLFIFQLRERLHDNRIKKMIEIKSKGLE